MTTSTPSTEPALSIGDVSRLSAAILEQVGSVVVGMREPLELALASILAGGHVLFEDVPGLGKTLAARSIAEATGLDFRRLQCTPDLLPADITGSFLYAPAEAEFVFRPGPVFTGLFLADEINRTSPKTQSALLEAMAEGQVTVEGQSFPLPSPFHVIATSNPIEYEGTYALPEAQLDRFMVRLSVGYPSRESEQRVLLNRVARQREVASVEAVITPETLRSMQATVESVHVDPDIALYCVDLVNGTRTHRDVQVGASPRGAQGLMLVGRARAVMEGRDFVAPEDVKAAAVPVLAHRISLTPQAWANGVDAAAVVTGIVAQVAGPPAVGARGAGSQAAAPSVGGALSTGSQEPA
ncbi:AAA family ATPase [Frondihabitans australicus]|uniref:MoxR-like ATPase n=1 Tax=Frondihabitans australicus TaxID=386892 RepID=A0A495IKJ7_9MICO|nr:MoxR family ATPase [Frondihabitans australicus]RKR76260.1 MoxR-like ATPase [Frondihabitans australicus]